MKKFLTGLLCLLILAGGCHEPACEEKRKENCICPFVYNPVCGCNGKTYGNSCDAECSGIMEYTAGACK